MSDARRHASALENAAVAKALRITGEQEGRWRLTLWLLGLAERLNLWHASIIERTSR